MINYEEDLLKGYTKSGAHKFDLEIKVLGEKSGNILSRGEQKLLILLIFLSFGDYFTTSQDKNVIYLIDDLASELDDKNLSLALEFLSISKGQLEAAKALGLNKFSIFFKVISPQVIRHALPGIGNVWQITLKDTSLISVTGLVEIMRQTRISSNVEHSPLTFLITAAILYLCLTTFSGRFFKYLEINYSKGYST